jgi:hypothetical protein
MDQEIPIDGTPFRSRLAAGFGRVRFSNNNDEIRYFMIS